MDTFVIGTILVGILTLFGKQTDAGCAYPDILHTYATGHVRYETCHNGYQYPLICEYDGTWKKVDYICDGGETAEIIARRVKFAKLLAQLQQYQIQRDSRNLLHRIIHSNGGLPPPHPPMSADDQLHVLLHALFGHHAYFPPGYPTSNSDDQAHAYPQDHQNQSPYLNPVALSIAGVHGIPVGGGSLAAAPPPGQGIAHVSGSQTHLSPSHVQLSNPKIVHPPHSHDHDHEHVQYRHIAPKYIPSE